MGNIIDTYDVRSVTIRRDSGFLDIDVTVSTIEAFREAPGKISYVKPRELLAKKSRFENAVLWVFFDTTL